MRKVGPFVLPLFRSILFLFLGLIFAIFTNQSLEEASQWWFVLCVVGNLLTIVVLSVVCKSEGTTYKQLIGSYKEMGNLKHITKITALMIVLGMSGMYASAYLIYGYVPAIMIQPTLVWLALINVILLPITIVFAELPLYFGYSLNGIEKITGNKTISIVYPMFFYALQHSFIPLIFDWQHILFRFSSFLPLLLMLGIMYYNKRKLIPLMIGHGILDLMAAFQIFISSIAPEIYEMMKSI